MKKVTQILFYLFITNFLFAQIDVNSWAYQLQDISISEITNNNSFELIVIDYSQDGSDEKKFTSEEILQIKNSGKKAIAYISIGEAETYRNYWNDSWDADNNGIPDAGAPSWLGIENPEWEGNYKVRYWNEEWQQIIFNYIDTIISQNFDGIYCDIVDGYYYWAEEVAEEPFADTLMVQFLENIRKHVDAKTNNRFFVIPQNGEYIIYETNITEQLREKYFSSIDAIGVEDVFFYGDLDEDNPYNPDNDRLNALSRFIEKDKTVFSIEYLTNESSIRTYLDEAKEKNFIPYTSTRALNILHDGIPLSVFDSDTEPPAEFELYQNYPNPFGEKTSSKKNSTTIKYSIKPISNSKIGSAKITIFDLLGREVKTFEIKNNSVGVYNVVFDASGFSGGVYFARLSANNYSSTISMLLIR